MEQKIFPHCGLASDIKKGWKGGGNEMLLCEAQEHFVLKPVIKTTAQTPARTYCPWKANTDSAVDA